MRTRERRRWFGVVFAAAGLVGVAAAGSINWLMDPYGVFGSVRIVGLNAVKPRPDVMVPEIKYMLEVKARPSALIVGNSRAEVGFDPDNDVFRARDLQAFNAAVPGSSIEYATSTLSRFSSANDIRVAVVGLEFLDFLRPPNEKVPAPARSDPFSATKTRLIALFSSTALVDSVRTFLLQRQRNPDILRSDGFNPMLDYRDIAATEGYRVLFQQRAQESARALAKEPHNLYVGAKRVSPAYSALNAILRTAGEKHIDLRLVIYPYHVILMSQLKEAGLWPLFEQWKSDVAELAEEARRSGVQVSLWDFGCPDAFTAEPVPAAGDRTTTMRWYWEAGHFKKELGDLVLRRVFGANPPQEAGGFGLELTPANVLERNQACSAELSARATTLRARQSDGTATSVDWRR